MPTKMNLYFGSFDIEKCHRDPEHHHLVDVATDSELVEFVNKGREAGGANLLEALLPSTPSNARACLIANALNFGCRITVARPFRESTNIGRWESRAWKWQMTLPLNISTAQVEEIRMALDLEYSDNSSLLLPEPIGNAARAFDMGIAFQEYMS